MTEDECIWAVKELLFDYVKSPSPRHISDPRSMIKLAQEIVRRIDRGNAIWRNWDGQREVLLKSALPCWIGVGSLRFSQRSIPLQQRRSILKHGFRFVQASLIPLSNCWKVARSALLGGQVV